VFHSGAVPPENELEERARRIVDSAVELAEEGGFEGVRLRDVASHAGVALGTLYRRFSSKEDLLLAALERETRDLEQRIAQRPPRGATGRERVAAFFSMATRGMCRRPNLARALLRAAAVGEPQIAQKVASYHERMESLILGSLRGTATNGAAATTAEIEFAFTLNLLWFALLLGWSSGVQTQAVVIEKMARYSELLHTDSLPEH
jgi:AcrR family transcriptional regulator